MASKLVLGANRGIGLAVVEQLCERGDQVIATCRGDRGGLDATSARVIANIDLSDDDSLKAIADKVSAADVDWVLVNAGVLAAERLGAIDASAAQSIRRQFEINALAPLLTVQALLPVLTAGARIGILTSRMGSMADNTSGGYYGYRMSKAAVNAAGRSLAMDLREQGIALAMLHPGFVRTQMTGGQGEIEPAQAAAGLIQRMDELDLASSGSFSHANGTPLPW